MPDRARRSVGVITRTLAGVCLLGVGQAWAADAPVNDAHRPPGNAAQIARGKQVFSVNCGFCHGSDGRGGEGGPNLLRSPLVLADQKGEIIYAVTRAGRPDKGMPEFDLSLDTISSIAAYPAQHSDRGCREDRLRSELDPGRQCRGGQGVLQRQGTLQSVSFSQGDFAKIGSRLDPKTLQDNIVSAGAFNDARRAIAERAAPDGYRDSALQARSSKER